MESTTFRTRVTPIGPVNTPNLVQNCDNHYVSYNNYDISIYGCDTTAIVTSEMNNFLILNGDHRGNLDGLSYQDAITYFHKNIHLKNSKSDPDENFRLSDLS